MDKKKDLFKESAHVVVRTGKFEICRTETQGRVDVPFHIYYIPYTLFQMFTIVRSIGINILI